MKRNKGSSTTQHSAHLIQKIESKDGGNLGNFATDALLPTGAKLGDTAKVDNYSNTGFPAILEYNGSSWDLQMLNQDIWTKDTTRVKLIPPIAPSNPEFSLAQPQMFLDRQIWLDKRNNDYEKVEVLNWATGYGFSGQFVQEIDWNITRGEWDSNPNLFNNPIIMKFKSFSNGGGNETFDVEFNYVPANSVGSKLQGVRGQLHGSNAIPNVFVGFKPVDATPANDKFVVLVVFGGNQNRFTVDLYARWIYFSAFNIIDRIPTVNRYGTTPAYATGFNGLAGTLGTDCQIVTFKNEMFNLNVNGLLAVNGGAGAIVATSDARMKRDLEEKEFAQLKEFVSVLKEIPQQIRVYKNTEKLVIGYTAQEILEIGQKVGLPEKLLNQFVITSNIMIDKNGKEFVDDFEYPEVEENETEETFSKKMKDSQEKLKEKEKNKNEYTPMLQVSQLLYDVVKYFN